MLLLLSSLSLTRMSRNNCILSMFYKSGKILSILSNKRHLLNGCKKPLLCCTKEHSTKVTTKEKFDLSQAITEAEKVIGYPTSVLGLRWLHGNDMPNIAHHLQKLTDSTDSIMDTARSIIFNEYYNLQAWGLIVLLISKAAGQTSQIDDLIEEKSSGILYKQITLAEITEMMRTAHLLHKGLINFQKKNLTPEELENLTHGNKMFLLSSDYLLGTSCAKLAEIKSNELLYIMSAAMKDLSESAFVGRRDNQNHPLPSVPEKDLTNYAIKEWTEHTFLNSGSLLSMACKGALLLAGYDEDFQNKAYKFGENFALSWQAAYDISIFANEDRNAPFNLCSAPVFFHIQYDPSLMIEIDKGLKSVENINYGRIFDIVTTGPGMKRTKELQREYAQQALELLNEFESSDAKMALSNILASIGN